MQTTYIKLEGTMIQSLNIHRHPDGTIDFDYYRRRATRRRRLARRAVFKHYLLVIGQSVRAIISAIERSTVDRSQDLADLRLTKRTRAAEIAQPT